MKTLEPVTQTQLQKSRFDLSKWTAVGVQNPCALLVECNANLVVLIAKDHEVLENQQTFEAVRVVTIPNGFRLRMLELKANVGMPCLPDEQLFMHAMTQMRRQSASLVIDGKTRITRCSHFPIKQLSALQYQTLVACDGRQLRSRLVSIFRQHLPPAVVNHRPWNLSTLSSRARRSTVSR